MTETSPRPRPLRVLAAMSGGVDSAVAAARAAEAGHDVTGVHLALSANPQSFRTGARGCCTIEDSRDARRAADVIGIPFYVWDLAERFREDVVEDFVAEYEAGRTPNPCLRCNEKIKFAALLDKALALGFDAVCTGHYAKVLVNEDGTRELHRASDMAKDQSYVLGVLDDRQLAHALFPLGDTLTTKDEIRAEAERRGLAVAKKPDSHDICFIADGDTQGFLANRLGKAEGDIVDESGAVVGSHEGAFGFTIGQRKGLRIGTPAADGKPRYVLDISPVDNRVTVGPATSLDVSAMTAIKPRWCGAAPAGPARTPPSSAPTAARRRSPPNSSTAAWRSRSPNRSAGSRPARRSSCTTARAWSARRRSRRPRGRRRPSSRTRRPRRRPPARAGGRGLQDLHLVEAQVVLDLRDVRLRLGVEPDEVRGVGQGPVGRVALEGAVRVGFGGRQQVEADVLRRDVVAHRTARLAQQQRPVALRQDLVAVHDAYALGALLDGDRVSLGHNGKAPAGPGFFPRTVIA